MNVREKDQFESSVVDIAFPGNLKKDDGSGQLYQVVCTLHKPESALRSQQKILHKGYKLHVHEYNIGKSCLVPVKSGI